MFSWLQREVQLLVSPLADTLPSNLDWSSWQVLALLWAIVFAAAFIRGLAGFGFPLVAVSFLVILFQPALIIPIVVVAQASFGLSDVVRGRKLILWRKLGLLVLGCVIGVPFGLAVLLAAPEALMRFLIGCVILLAALLLLSGFSLKTKPRPPLILGTGVISGVLHGAAAMAGPPAVFLMVASGRDVAQSRATLLAFFACAGWAAWIGLALRDAITWHQIALGLSSLPVMLAGFETGRWSFHRLGGDQATFRRVASLLLFVAAAVLMLRSGLAYWG